MNLINHPARTWILIPMTGMLWAFSFPLWNWTVSAWCIPALLFAVASLDQGEHAFRNGYLIGLTHFLCSLYWLLYIPFPAGAISGWLSLSAYLALYPASWCWLMHRVHSVALSSQSSWWHRQCRALFGACLWVALEMVQARFLTGFPWNFLGVSQAESLPLIQIASVTGVYGISFIMVWISLGLAHALLRLRSDAGKRKVHNWNWMPDLLLPGVALACIIFWGMKQMLAPQPLEREIKIASIQPSIPQTLIWDPSTEDTRFNTLLRLTREALQTKPDLLLWPEAALPTMIRYDREKQDQIRGLLLESPAWMIIGSDDAEPIDKEGDPDEYAFANSAFLISPEGQLMDRYKKRQLVIFGEYVPFSDTLPFLKYLTPIQGAFMKGTRPASFVLEDPAIRLSPLICFEDVFPHLAREHVTENTDLLVNLTNNGWFGESAAQWQHAAMARFRAVENNIPLVRCTNNGLTCWIDPKGRLHGVDFEQGGSIYQSGVKYYSIPVRIEGVPLTTTFYHRNGDVFGWSCLMASSLVAFFYVLSRRKLVLRS